MVCCVLCWLFADPRLHRLPVYRSSEAASSSNERNEGSVKPLSIARTSSGTSWSTSRGISKCTISEERERRFSDEPPAKRSLFDKFKLDRDVVSSSAENVPPSHGVSKVGNSQVKSRSKSATSYHPDNANAGNKEQSNTRSSSMADERVCPGPSTLTNNERAGKLWSAQRETRPTSNCSVTSSAHSQVKGGLGHPASSVTSVFEKLTQSLYDETAVPDSTTSDMPQPACPPVNTPVISSSPKQEEECTDDAISVHNAGQSSKQLLEDDDDNDTASLPSLVMASDVEDDPTQSATPDGSFDDVQFLEDGFMSDAGDLDQLSVMSGESAPYQSPGASEDDCSEGHDSEEESTCTTHAVASDQTDAKSTKLKRALDHLAISSAALYQPPDDTVSLPEFISDPSSLTREQRKLQQTLLQFQTMEMRASAKALRQEKRKKERKKKRPVSPVKSSCHKSEQFHARTESSVSSGQTPRTSRKKSAGGNSEEQRKETEGEVNSELSRKKAEVSFI